MNYRKPHRGKLAIAMTEIDIMNRRWQHSNFTPQCIGLGSGGRPRGSLVSPSHGLSVSGSGCGDIMGQICEISDGLYLSGARAIRITKLRELGITTIFNVTIELPNLPIDNVEYVKISIEDSPFSNLGYYFDRVADKIEEVRRRGGKALVHCVAGVSRSASLCIAYLMKHKRMSLRKAYQHVKSRRHIIRPNPGFFRQLVEYESRILGTTSVAMVWNTAAGGHIPDLYEPEYDNTVSFLSKYGPSDRTTSTTSSSSSSNSSSSLSPWKSSTSCHRR